MNNFEKIKNMDIDDMTKFIHSYAENLDDCVYCPLEKFCFNDNNLYIYDNLNCIEIIKQWLQQEIKI